MIKHNNKCYKTLEAGPWHGLALTEAIEEVKELPAHRWNGERIPLALAKQILSFFKWSQDTTQSETVVNLLWHEKLGWAAAVFPQEGHTGMTVNLLPDHPDRAATFARFGAPEGIPYVQMGTWHHHCGAPAFASSKDTSDEVTKEGIHLTTGDLGKTQYSLHARTSFRNVLSACNLGDWFECPAGIAPHLEDLQVMWLLCQPSVEEFPVWWKENVHRVVHAAPQGMGLVPYGSGSAYGRWWEAQGKGNSKPKEKEVAVSGNWVRDEKTGMWHEESVPAAAPSPSGYTAQFSFVEAMSYARLNDATEVYLWLSLLDATATEIVETLVMSEKTPAVAMREMEAEWPGIEHEAVALDQHKHAEEDEDREQEVAEAAEELLRLEEDARIDRDWPCHTCGTSPCRCAVAGAEMGVAE